VSIDLSTMHIQLDEGTIGAVGASKVVELDRGRVYMLTAQGAAHVRDGGHTVSVADQLIPSGQPITVLCRSGRLAFAAGVDATAASVWISRVATSQSSYE